jgi:DNA-binding LacI/PurR family transcriptional regulator
MKPDLQQRQGERAREPRKRTTIADIARRARVSTSAVSYALNGRPGVGEATRRHILALAERMAWRPNSAARALSAARAQAVGMVIAKPFDPFGFAQYFMRFLSGIEEELSGRDIALVLHVVASREAEAAVYERWYSEHRVDGVIVMNLHQHDLRTALLEELGLPAVAAGPAGGNHGVPAVWTDDEAAAMAAVEYLARLGHRTIARVGGPPDLLHSQVRKKAFLRAIAATGLASPISVDTDYHCEDATRELLSSARHPTAIIYESDEMAVTAAAVARDAGIVIPRDLSIIAWDDSPLCEIVEPRLTALRRDIAAYGGRVAAHLLALLDGADVGDVQGSATYLVPRRSTAPPPASS